MTDEQLAAIQAAMGDGGVVRRADEGPWWRSRPRRTGLDLKAMPDAPPPLPTALDREERKRVELPPFSGVIPRCVKCGNLGATTKYLAFGRCLHGSDRAFAGYEPNERLHRECGRCGYAWDEALASE